MKFELLVASRYLKARRKQAVISRITFITIVGVAAGVGALIVAMAMNAGIREELRGRLLGADAHLWVLPRSRDGISDYINVAKEIEKIDGVAAAAPCAYQGMVIEFKGSIDYAFIKGVLPNLENRVSTFGQHIIDGDINQLEGGATIAIGKELAALKGIKLGDTVRVASGQSEVLPMGGTRPKNIPMTVVAIFETGLYEYDLHLALVPLARAQYLLATDDVVNRIDVNVKDLNHAPEVAMRILEKLGPKYDVESWEDRTKSVFQGLKLERLGLAIAIGLIVFVAALNIVATLTMMVLEKTRDIATLMAMGATLSQIRRVFMLQGVIIGIVGTAVGVVLGHAVSYTVDTYKLIWLDPALYTIDHLPFSAGIGDTVIIAAAAIFISFLATLYPSAAAAKLQPVEALRYE